MWCVYSPVQSRGSVVVMSDMVVVLVTIMLAVDEWQQKNGTFM